MTQHAPPRYSSKEAKLVYGVDALGVMRHISEVQRGDACACNCPACNAPLTARKGHDNVHHFGHQASTSCSTAPETALHRLGKKIVATKLHLVLPEVRAEFNGGATVIHEAGQRSFDKAIQEARHLQNVVPDLYVERAGRRLLVEIYVTHACDELKRAELKNRGIATVEIDLSRLPRNASRSEVEATVLETARRYWVFHPKIDAEVTAMRTRHQSELDAQRLRFEKEVADCLRRYDLGLKELANRKDKPLNEDGEFFRIGLDAHIGCSDDFPGVKESQDYENDFLSFRLLPQGRTVTIRRAIRGGGVDWYEGVQNEGAIEGVKAETLHQIHGKGRKALVRSQRGFLITSESASLKSLPTNPVLPKPSRSEISFRMSW